MDESKGELSSSTEAQSRDTQKPAEYWFDYENVFDDVLHGKDSLSQPVEMPVEICELEFRKVYETPVGFQWNSWVKAFLTPEGEIELIFETIEGGPPDLESDYKWQFVGPEILAESGISRTHRHMESKDYGYTWNTMAVNDASNFSLPSVLPAICVDNGTFLGTGGVQDLWDDTINSYLFVGSLSTALSRDKGSNWDRWNTLNDASDSCLVFCRPKLLRDGTIVLPAYGKMQRNVKNPTVPWDACLFFSADGGLSWSEPLVLAMGTDTLSMEEPEAVELGNGDLLVILRQTNPSKVGTNDVYCNCGQIIVKKMNEKWIVGPLMTTPLRFRGMPTVLRTHEGILICSGSGNQYNFSVDDGKTWSDTQSVADPMYNRHNHYPVLVEIPDGRIMSIYHFGNDWPYPPPEPQWIHTTFFRVSKF